MVNPKKYEKQELPQIMVGCPINHQREWIVQYYLDNIYKLNYPKSKIHIAFLYNYPKTATTTEIEATLKFLKDFKKKTSKEYKQFDIWTAETNYTDGRVEGRRFDIFSKLRNTWLSMRTQEDDYLFSVDSDILLPLEQSPQNHTCNYDGQWTQLIPGWKPITPNQTPQYSNALHQLLQYDKPVVAAMIYNGKTQGNLGDDAFNFMSRTDEQHGNGDYIYIHRQPGALIPHSTWVRDEQPPYLWRMTDVPSVGMSGAVMLIKKEVIDSGVCFGHHEQGEDVYFSEQVKEKGFDIYVDWTLQPQHIMSPSQLNQYLGLPAGVSVFNPMEQLVHTKKVDDAVVDVIDKGE